MKRIQIMKNITLILIIVAFALSCTKKAVVYFIGEYKEPIMYNEYSVQYGTHRIYSITHDIQTGCIDTVIYDSILYKLLKDSNIKI